MLVSDGIDNFIDMRNRAIEMIDEPDKNSHGSFQAHSFFLFGTAGIVCVRMVSAI